MFTFGLKYAIIDYVNSERRRVDMILDSRLDITDFKDLKRVTFLTRDYLERRQLGYFTAKTETLILINTTDKKIDDKLKELNKTKHTRLFKVEKDFKLTSKVKIKEYKHYLIDNNYL